jgi:hypothetical protein
VKLISLIFTTAPEDGRNNDSVSVGITVPAHDKKKIQGNIIRRSG